jgi:hypothetical protein
MHDSALAAVGPEVNAVHIVVRDPKRGVMAVTLNVARAPHACERATGRTAKRVEKGAAVLRTVVITGQFPSIALKRILLVRFRQDL